jgi:uncharacterized protein DUF5990/bacteriocin resistance YdeI/OmpD-like protein
MPPVKLEVEIERKLETLPGFVVVPAAKIAHWKLSGTTTVDATLDGLSLGRRSLKRWDDQRWFLELRAAHLEAIGKGKGQRATLTIEVAATKLPAELQRLIDTDARARANWEALSDSRKRMLREELLDVKTAATRETRARQALLPAPGPSQPSVRGLPPRAVPVTLTLLASRLPGRSCGPYRDVDVRLSFKTGKEPELVVRADARSARWETMIELGAADGVPTFKGPAVHGPPHQRFLYLSWVGRKANAAAAMFRRAKLRLDAVPADVLVKSLRSGKLVGRLGLTARDGMPVCASVRPPAIEWSDS